ncbi:MAG: gluconate 2-dehydrogenase subunit 3 family protein [Bryobacteraceae bacterium]
MSVRRRDLVVILGAGASVAEVFAQHGATHGKAIDFGKYKPRVFSDTEYAMLDALTEAILPADESGPGAHAAHVVYYIDVTLHYQETGVQRLWKEGLASLNAAARQQFGAEFAAGTPAQQHALLARLSSKEADPVTGADRFFVELKRMTIQAFYASDLIQKEHLGYRGNTAIDEFPGCEHPSHPIGRG